MNTAKEMATLATAGAPELLDLRLLGLLCLLSSRAGSLRLSGSDLQERVAVHNLLPLLGPFERGGFALVEEESHILY